MTSLESIFLPLAESRALAEAGIVLDTALVWVYVKDANGKIVLTVMPSEDAAADCLGADCDGQKIICGAPVLSELMNAIYARYDNAEITMYGSGLIDVWIGKEAHQQNEDTDLLAAYALLREVSK